MSFASKILVPLVAISLAFLSFAVKAEEPSVTAEEATLVVYRAGEATSTNCDLSANGSAAKSVISHGNVGNSATSNCSVVSIVGSAKHEGHSEYRDIKN